MKLIKKLNYFFLADEDDYIPVSDYVWFYGFNGMLIILNLYMVYKTITF